MSHELRTPLNAIAGFAEILGTGVHGPLNEKQADALKRIQKNEQDLLAHHQRDARFRRTPRRHSAGGQTSTFRFADAFDAAELLIAPEVERKHLVVERDSPDRMARRVGPTQGSPADSCQPALERVQVHERRRDDHARGRREGDKVRIWVRDTGIGIGKGEMPRVFEPFFQADGGTTRRYSGVGLGLTIARDLARQMEGEVTITSEEGKGTTASVVLPVRALRNRENAAENPARNVAA